ncbi:MAG: flagellar biosynthesis protein FlhF [Kyrpidia sp.]|nr:flagellar biosynthesis protein FlhF [Kyrpidia sp.]
MRIKRFTATDMAAALARVREELGADAVILNTREVPGRRWLPWRAGKRIEIVAAVEDGPRDSAAVHGERRSLPVPSPAESSRRRQPVGAGHPANLNGHLPLGTHPDQTRNDGTGRFSGQGAAAGQGNRYPWFPPSGQGNRAGVSDDEWRALIRKLACTGQSPAALVLNELTGRLVAGGMDESRAHALAESAVLAMPDEGPWEMDVAMDRLREVIRNQLDPWVSSPMSSDSRVIAMAGPTGVGKTTSIAKLAAIEALDAGRRVALISADTYRIAAVDQLRTYAEIIGIPCLVVYSTEEMRQAVEQLSGCDRIFIDTAGRNFIQRDHVAHLAGMLEAARPDETYLVLSLSGKGADLRRMVDALRDVRIDKYLFTKADETDSFASALDLVLKETRPVSYITTGQSVPDDIVEATLSYLVERL